VFDWYERLVPIQPSQHQQLGWLPAQNLAMVSDRQWLPACLGELTQAAAHVPIAIVEQQGKRGQSKISLTFGSHSSLEAVSTATHLNKQGVSSA